MGIPESFPAQPKVLIADDTATMRMVLQEMVSLTGYQAVLAESGEECIDVAVCEHPDLILLDIMMPGGLDGFQTFEALKKRHETRGIPVIFLTGMDDLETKLKGFEMGAVDYITKPFHMVEVQARLRLHLKMSYAMNALIRAQQEKLKQIESAQQAMLVTPEAEPSAHFAVFIRQLQEAGGDFYDIIPISEHMRGYFIADVSGHDLRSGFITPAIKALLCQNCSPAYSPMDSMTLINSVLVGFLPNGKYLTAAYLVIDRVCHHATLIGMGHPPVILKRCNGSVTLFPDESDVLGAFSEVIFSETQLDVAPGDRFYLYSDGLIEGTGIADIWTGGTQKLAEIIGKIPEKLSPEEDVAWLIKNINIDPEKLKDDVMLICTEV